MSLFEELEQELDCLKSKNNLRRLPATHHRGREVEADGNVMLNLSSNDYLGLATAVSYTHLTLPTSDLV